MPCLAAASPAADKPPVEVYDAALVDLDGVVYLEEQPIPGAATAVERAEAAGMRVAFVTNNAQLAPAGIAARLQRLGINAAPENVASSAQAAAELVAERFPAGSSVLVVGSAELRHIVAETGLRPVALAADQPVAVVQGRSPDLAFEHLAEGALAVGQGALFVATNLDLSFPTARGLLPGNGALVQVIRATTGVEPVVAGKPHTPLFAAAVRRTSAKKPLFVGDQLHTDIAGAVAAGMDSMLVLTGVTRPVDLLLAPADRRPTYIAEDLTGLLTAHSAVQPTHDGYRCKGWEVRLSGDDVSVTGSGSPVAGLAAACAAVWSTSQPVTPSTAAKLVAGLGFDSVP